jgi:hypothetical protein
MRTACLFILLGVLQAPLHAQSLEPSQQLGPDPAEFQTPEGPQSTLFGATVARQGNTALIQEAGYPNFLNIGRVAVFTLDANGKWVRNGSIDPPNGQSFDFFGSPLAIFGDVALIGSVQGMYVFHRKNGQWKQLQLLHLKTPWRFTDVALNRDFAFLATELNTQGVVYAYRVRPKGRLEYIQRLDSGVDFDSYAERLALSGDRLVVSASGDDAGRGAAYVFQRHGHRWAKRQKLVAIDGAPKDSFGADVAISNDRIAIGAPNVQGRPDPFCFSGGNTGAVYTFRLINGTWLHEQVLLAEDGLPAGSGCRNRLGEDVVLSGRWLAAQHTLPELSGDIALALVYRREAGQFTLAFGIGRDGPQLSLDLSDATLFAGEPVERGCNFDVCIGTAFVYDLE